MCIVCVCVCVCVSLSSNNPAGCFSLLIRQLEQRFSDFHAIIKKGGIFRFIIVFLDTAKMVLHAVMLNKHIFYFFHYLQWRMSSLRIPGLLWLVSSHTPEPSPLTLSPAGSDMFSAFNELHTASIMQMFDTSGAVVSVGKRSSGWCGPLNFQHLQQNET